MFGGELLDELLHGRVIGHHDSLLDGVACQA
jgi:hypothetical protein